MFDHAAAFMRALTRHVWLGAPEVSDETFGRRLAVCRGCAEHHVPGPPEQCSACGCLLQLKARWAEQACPIGKWAADPAPPSGRAGGCSGCPSS